MEFKTFSCYDNFVPCNNCGAPEHTPTHHTLQHLERLLQCASARLRNLPVSQLRPQPQRDSSKASPDNTSSSNDVESPSSDMDQSESGPVVSFFHLNLDSYFKMVLNCEVILEVILVILPLFF